MRPHLVETNTRVYYFIIKWDQCYHNPCALIYKACQSFCSKRIGKGEAAELGVRRPSQARVMSSPSGDV